MAQAVRLLIAEDQYLMREGTRALLEKVEGIEVVGTAFDYDSVVKQARDLRPDAILMDIKMPPTNTTEGIRAAHLLKSERPELGVLVLSLHDDESYVWALLEHGVEGYGYLHKVRVGDVDQLVHAIRAVAAGGSVVDPRIIRSVLANRAGKPDSRLSGLTTAELDVLRLMAEGKTNAAIGRDLSIALGTVEKRVASVFGKLGLEDEGDTNRRVAAVLIYLCESVPAP